MATITVTRALAERKLLVKRLEKNMSDLKLVAVKVGDKLTGAESSYREDDFVIQAKSDLQATKDLYDRLIKIQKAIKESNAKTVIKVGKEEMTVQDAIAEKENIQYKKNLLRKLKALSNTADNNFAAAQEKNEKAIESLVSGTIGKDTTDAQKVAARKDAENFINQNKAVAMVDPCDIKTLVKTLEEEIDDFESNVDYALSESNSTTMIEI